MATAQNPAVTGSATDITLTTATLVASVWAGNEGLVQCWFDYGPTEVYASSTAVVTPAGFPATVTAQISGLTPGTTYHFSVRVQEPEVGGWQGQIISGADCTFVTGTGGLPAASTGQAAGVSENAAMLWGSVNAQGVPATYHFEYGPTTSYGSSSPAASAGTLSTPQQVSSQISNLAPGIRYHFRVVAQNAAGTTAGADNSFILAAPGGARRP